MDDCATTSRLRRERLRRGWSLTQLTVRSGISSTDLSLLERGARFAYPKWRRVLAEVLEMSEGDLFEPVPGAAKAYRAVVTSAAH
jgi:transcriptional regulator with XRE-family HTH domain